MHPIKFLFWIKKWLPEEKEQFASDLWKIYQVRSQMNLAILEAFEVHHIRLALPIRLNVDSELSTGIYSEKPR